MKFFWRTPAKVWNNLKVTLTKFSLRERGTKCPCWIQYFLTKTAFKATCIVVKLCPQIKWKLFVCQLFGRMISHFHGNRLIMNTICMQLLLNKLQSGTDNTNIMCCKKFGKIFKTCLACDGVIGVTVLLLVNEYAIHVH